jgi:hypothetical protein
VRSLRQRHAITQLLSLSALTSVKGWHGSCLDPPLDEVPDGEWHCPRCPPLDPPPQDLITEASPAHTDGMLPEPAYDPHAAVVGPFGVPPASPPIQVEQDIPEQTASIRSSSPPPMRRAMKPVVVLSDSDDDDDDTEDDEELDIASLVPVSHSRAKGKSKSKPRVRRPSERAVGAASATPARPAKRQKMMPVSASPPPTSARPPRVRLTLRGKHREEDDEPPKGLFDDILNPEDRDTTETSIQPGDKNKFERSRQTAEVEPLRPL